MKSQKTTWAENEFSNIDFGDVRLTKRLIKLSDSLSDIPQSSINQACGSWSQTKAAYRFFKNEKVDVAAILSSHSNQSAERAKQEERILAIQDTSYICYKNHPKTKGLGLISKRKGLNKTEIKTDGLIMHTTFAVTTEGLPLGLLDQVVYAREPLPEEKAKIKKSSHGCSVSIEDKESIKWLNAVNKTHDLLKDSSTKVVTVCDREADIYDFFECAHSIGEDFLVRSNQTRNINKKSLHSKKNKETIKDFMEKQASQGQIQVKIPAKKNMPARTATLDISFASFTVSPSRNNIRKRTQELSNFTLSGILVIEKKPPKDIGPLEWILVANLIVNDFDAALEKVRWYCLRWRTEVFHKILKSGFLIEDCRLSTAERLIRYITLMSIIAWRIFYITLIARTHPGLPCTKLLDKNEWQVLYVKIHRSQNYPKVEPTIRTVVSWIAQLGGFLARKGDGGPGPMALWRGWRRLTDLCEGWELANCG
jgi:Transposase DNA-binding/Transposase Tn5 dimerisation domain